MTLRLVPLLLPLLMLAAGLAHGADGIGLGAERISNSENAGGLQGVGGGSGEAEYFGDGIHDGSGDVRQPSVRVDELARHLFNEMAGAILDDFGPRGALRYFNEEEEIKREEEEPMARAALLRGFGNGAVMLAEERHNMVVEAGCCCSDIRAHCRTKHFHTTSAAEEEKGSVSFFKVTKCLAARQHAHGDLEPRCAQVLNAGTVAGACFEDIKAGAACSSVEPGHHRLHRCLQKHQSQLSTRCKRYMDHAFPSYMMLPKAKEIEIEGQKEEVEEAAKVAVSEKGKREQAGNADAGNNNDKSTESVMIAHRPRWVWIAIASIIGVGVVLVAALATIGRKSSAGFHTAESVTVARNKETLYTSLLVASPVRLKPSPYD